MMTDRKRKPRERWVWCCNWDDWSWEDGYRCRARASKPFSSEDAARAAGERHIATTKEHPQYYRGHVVVPSVWKLNKYQRWKR